VRPHRLTRPHRAGLASGHTISTGADAARWGWFLDLAARDDAEHTTLGNQGNQGRTERLAVLLDETGYRLGSEQAGESWVAETQTAGNRRAPSSGALLRRSADSPAKGPESASPKR
jgi:hypothetical protein